MSGQYYADVLIPLLGAKGPSLFAMFKAFLDESGMEGNLSTVIGGVMGRTEECDLAANCWKDTLRTAGIKEFHSLEFWNRTDGKMHGEYAHLSIADADLLAERLTEILSMPSLRSIGIALGVKAFMSLTEDERRWLTTNKRFSKSWPSEGSPTNPYFFAFQAVAQIVARETPNTDKAYFIFDRQEDFADRARKLYNETLALDNEMTHKMAESLVFSSKSCAVLLQGADFVAYLSRWYAENRDSMYPLAYECFRRLGEPEQNKILMITAESFDVVLQRCPFRRTFWPELNTRPDFVEQMRMNGYNVLAYKVADTYLSQHIRPDKVRVIGKMQRTGEAGGIEQFGVVKAQDEDRNV